MFGLNTPIYNRLREYYQSDPTIFHMPGHKLGRGIPEDFRKELLLLDVTEIPGTDNLHFPEGIIREAQRLAACAFGADETFFLVNGSTCGIHAMILTVCRPGDKLIVSRDCHQAVIHGMMLAGAEPVYLKPGYDRQFHITTAISTEDLEHLLAKHPDAAGVLITRPNYYGVCADIQRISEITHRYGKVLMVDEAHGAHLRFGKGLPCCAMDGGADICVQSAHKTLPALTQSAYLHIKNNRIDVERLKNNLRILQTTSPSYIFMAYLDIARAVMEREGRGRLAALSGEIDRFKSTMQNITKARVLSEGMINNAQMDITRLVIDVRNFGKSGFETGRLLGEEFNIQVEMADLFNIVCIATIADRRSDFEKLYFAFRELSRRFIDMPPLADIHINEAEIPEQRIGFREMMQVKGKQMKLHDAAGKVSCTTVTPYPPGIPLICPGEIILKESVEFIDTIMQAGGIVHGLDGNLNVCVAQ